MNTVAQVQAAKTAELVAFYNRHNPEKPIKKFSDRATAEKRCIDLVDMLNAINSLAEVEAAPVAEVAPVAPVAEVKTDFESALEVNTTIEEEEDKAFKVKAIHAQILRNIARSEYTNVNGAEPSSLKDIDYVWMNCVVDTAKEKDAIAELMKAGLVTKDKGVGADACVSLSREGFYAYKALPVGTATEAKPEKAPSSGASNAAGVSASWANPDVVAARLTRDSVTVTFQGKTEEFKSTRAAFTHYALPDGKHIRFRMKLKASRHEVFEYNDGKYEFKIVAK